MVQRGRTRNIVLDKTTGKDMTLNQFVKKSTKEIEETHLTRSAVVRRKLLTKADLDRIIAEGGLKEIIYKDKSYISRKELFDFLNSKLSATLF